jgi:outer membrane protein OmpA-like peptidoglycan-associated protein
MHRSALVAALVLIAAGAGTAAADPVQLGLFFGPRVFSSDSRLGYIEDNPAHPMLDNALTYGFRVARPLLPWLVPELELGLSKTGTPTVPPTSMRTGAAATDVFWMEPRLQLRFEILPEKRIMPFVVIGGGMPVVFSSARKTYDSGLTGEGYVGGGVRFDTRRGFAIRFDARASMAPGEDRVIGYELDFNVGVELQLGGRRKATTEVLPPAVVDRDDDGIPDAKDQCPDRAEDPDGFEDLDGCPDIDNDGDLVLDIADRCANVPETYNGFEDDDGCPDTLPADVEALKGTIEGLLYAEGETAVRDSAKANLEKIAKLMQTYPSIKVLLIGHTDDREANQFAPKPVKGEPPPDTAQLAEDLSKARAEAVKQALVAIGVPATRVEVDGKGAEEPVAENEKPRGRLANRRVEIKLYVPPRPTTSVTGAVAPTPPPAPAPAPTPAPEAPAPVAPAK